MYGCNSADPDVPFTITGVLEVVALPPTVAAARNVVVAARHVEDVVAQLVVCDEAAVVVATDLKVAMGPIAVEGGSAARAVMPVIRHGGEEGVVCGKDAYRAHRTR